MRTVKKLCSLLLSILLLAAAVPLPAASAQEAPMSGACGEGLTWVVEPYGDPVLCYDRTGEPVEDPASANPDETHFETRYTLTVSGSGAIPDYRADEEVCDERPWEYFARQIAVINVGDNVTEIGDCAFREFNRLKEVNLPEGLTRIGERAFENCRNGWDAEDGNGWQPHTSMKSFSIPSTVESIGENAFREMVELETVNFAGDLKSILLKEDRYAEWDMENWPALEFYRRVFENTALFESMVADAMQGAAGDLNWVVEPYGEPVLCYDRTGEPVEDPSAANPDETHYETRYALTLSGSGAIPDYRADREVFDERPWEYFARDIAVLTVESGVTEIGDCAFREFNRLKEVNLPDGLTRIGERAFENCRNGWDAKDGNGWQPRTSMEVFSIPSTVASIGENAFREMVELETVNFAGDLKSILLKEDRYAEWDVENWPALELYRRVFENTALFESMVADSMQGDVGDLNWTVEVNNDYSYLAYDEPGDPPVEDPGETENTHWETRYTLTVSGSGAIPDYRADEEVYDERPWEYFARRIAVINVGDNVTEIGDCAFRDFNRLAEVNLPQGLTRIGERAFEHCCEDWDDESGRHIVSGLESITLPDSLVYLGPRAFADNMALDEVNFNGELMDVCLAGEEFAADWPALERVFDVFGNTPWLENWTQTNFMSGDCGEGLTWQLEENGDGLWVYNENGLPVPDPALENEEDIHFERRLTLVIEGEGAMDDYIFDFEHPENSVLPPWDYFSGMVTEIDVGAGVTHVGSNAFRWFSELKKVTLREGLESIGALAFESCKHGVGEGDDWTPVYGLEQIDIPASVTYIGPEAFARNDYLETVNAACDLPAVCLAGDAEWADMLPPIRVMNVFDSTPWSESWIENTFMRGECGDNASWALEETGDGVWVWFDGTPVEDPADYGAKGTFYATFYRLVITGTGPMWDYADVSPAWEFFGINVREIEIGEGITHVGENAFGVCPELREVSLPYTLQSVGENAFGACTHLETVRYGYPGTAEEWDAVSVAAGNDPLKAARVLLHTHTPGQPVNENVYPPSCEDDGGYDTVIRCVDCGKVLSKEHVPVPAAGHKYGEPVYQWSKDLSACTAKRICATDSTHVLAEKGVVTSVTTPAACTTDGKIVYTAVFNNKSYETQQKTVILPALGHDIVNHAAKAPTCTEGGWAAYQTCSRCDHTTFKALPALGHTPGAAVKENETAAGYDTVVYCAVCKKELSRSHKDVSPAPALKPGDVDGNGKITASDARLTLRAAVRLEEFYKDPSGAKFIAADVDKNQKITAADARKILRAAVKLEVLE